MFRSGAEAAGDIEIAGAGRRLAAALFAACVIGGEMAQSARPVAIHEPKRRLAYRFKPAALGGRDDRLWIRSQQALQAPPLRIVHLASRQTVSVVGGFRVAGDAAREFDLRPLRAVARGQSGVVGAFRRIAGAREYEYALELDDPADQDWLEIVHPPHRIDSQLGFAWQ